MFYSSRLVSTKWVCLFWDLGFRVALLQFDYRVVKINVCHLFGSYKTVKLR